MCFLKLSIHLSYICMYVCIKPSMQRNVFQIKKLMHLKYVRNLHLTEQHLTKIPSYLFIIECGENTSEI